MQEIKERNDYLQLFSSKQSDALKQAIENRKFEIALYWKRAAYFGAMLAAIFAAYFIVQKGELTFQPDSSLIISILGFAFSFCWYRVNRGSRFWLRNWDLHVELLEDEIIGPLHKTLIDPGKSFRFIGIAPYSVTTIHEILSLFVVWIWIYLIATLAITYWDLMKGRLILLILMVLFFILLLLWFGRINRHKEPIKTNFIKRNIEEEVLEKIAFGLHEQYCENQRERGVCSSPFTVPWEELTNELKAENLNAAKGIVRTLHELGYRITRSKDPVVAWHPTSHEIETLAQAEHARWVRNKKALGWRSSPNRDGVITKTHPYLLSWDNLPEDIKEMDRSFASSIGPLFSKLRLAVIRLTVEAPSVTDKCTDSYA